MPYPNFESTDIVIIGGGPIGGTLACMLALNGFKVTVIDKCSRQKKLDLCSDGRAWSITAGSVNFLTSLGIWENAKKYATPIKKIRVSDNRCNSFVHYDEKELYSDALGYIIQSSSMNFFIQQVANGLSGIKWIEKKEVTKISFSDSCVYTVIENTEMTLSSPLVVIADGRQSPWRKKMYHSLTNWSYGQTALVFDVTHEKPHLDTAFEHFRSKGPIAVLPTLKPTVSSVVWSEVKQNIEYLQVLNDKDFIKIAQNEFGNYLGNWVLSGNRWSYPLTGIFVRQLFRHRTVFIGDAAHGIHPVAGQGLNLGFQGVETLAKILVDFRSVGVDIGSDLVLEKYDINQKLKALLMTFGCDSIVRLFSTNFLPAKLSRRFALDITQKIPFIRKFLAHYAMGLSLY